MKVKVGPGFSLLLKQQQQQHFFGRTNPEQNKSP